MKVSLKRSLVLYLDAIDAYLAAGGYKSELARAFGVGQSYFNQALKQAREAPKGEQHPLPFDVEVTPVKTKPSTQVSSPKPTPKAQGAKAPAPQGQENPLSPAAPAAKKPPPPGTKDDADRLRKLDIGFDPDDI